METLVSNVHYKNQWTCSPGRVGSVGATAIRTRLKQSCPDLPMRFVDDYGTTNGSYIDDGYGANCRTDDQFWSPIQPTQANGMRYQDLRVPPTTREIDLKEIPQYSWMSQIAVTNTANTRQYQYLPQGYNSDWIKGLPRGGLYPRLVKFVGDEGIPTRQSEPIGKGPREFPRNLRRAPDDEVEPEEVKRKRYTRLPKRHSKTPNPNTKRVKLTTKRPKMKTR